MRTDFTVSVNGKDFEFKAETWQEALNNFLSALNENGFVIEDNKRERIVEVATSGMVTVK